MQNPEIYVSGGPLDGRRYAVPAEGGLRLGRSSSCEIAVADPALSRNHCLFEVREDGIWVTDLASANGTFVNSKLMGVDSVRLAPGDVVTAGDAVLYVIAPGETPDTFSSAAAHTARMPPPNDLGKGTDTSSEDIDLGLGRENTGEENASARPPLSRLLLWGAAGVALLVAAAVILMAPAPDRTERTVNVIRTATDDTLLSVSFEKVDASSENVYRYALEYAADGSLRVAFDDVPRENRHLNRQVKLSSAARKRLAAIFTDKRLFELEPEYAGSGVAAGVLKSIRLKVVRGDRVFETTVENAVVPDVLREACAQLEAFSKNELGAWALQYSADKLQEMSAASRKTGDSKWDERDVQYGNLAAALFAYDEAIVYLDTVNPKPADYNDLLARRDEVRKELDRRYREQSFLVDRAAKLADWNTARSELRILCDMVPDERDPRHAEAKAKLLDIEARQKKGENK